MHSEIQRCIPVNISVRDSEMNPHMSEIQRGIQRLQHTNIHWNSGCTQSSYSIVFRKYTILWDRHESMVETVIDAAPWSTKSGWGCRRSSCRHWTLGWPGIYRRRSILGWKGAPKVGLPARLRPVKFSSTGGRPRSCAAVAAFPLCAAVAIEDVPSF